MDAKLKTICGLLQNPDPSRRSAAAMVLAALAPREAAVARALGEALPGANQMLTTAILDAFDAIGGREGLPYLLPLLETPDMAVKMRALQTIAKAGAAGLPLILPQLAGASPAQKLVFVDLLGRVQSADAMRALLDLLPGADAPLAAEIADAIHRHAGTVAPATRSAGCKLVVQFMNGKMAKGSERLQGSALLLLGALGRPEARPLLLRLAKPGQPPRLRQQALRGLQHLEWTPATARPVVEQVLPYAEDRDGDVAQQTLRFVESLPADTLTAAQWRKLLASPLGSVRSLAVTRLTADDTAASNHVLMELLNSEGQLGDMAAGALARHPKAAPELAEALLQEDVEESAWRLAKILKPHAATLEPKLRKRLADQTARALKATLPRAGALLYLLRNADANAADALARDAAFAAMRAKRWAEAVEGFRRLIHSPGFDDECAYALSLCNLKVSQKELAPQLRAEDYALRGFSRLLRGGNFPLHERLSKEKILEAEDLYYVGFHFSDLTDIEREFGEAILQHVAQTWPRSPSGKAARSKLGVGADEPEKKRKGKGEKKAAKAK